MIHVQAPDGSLIEFPDGTADDTITSVMAKNFPAPDPHREGSSAAAVGAGIVDGIPLIGPAIKGGVERAAAGIRSLQNGTGYGDELKNVQAFDRGLQTDHPAATTAGKIGGAVVTGGGLAKAGLSLGVNAIKAGSGLLRVAGGSAADGAILGAAQGFGEGDGLGDRAGKALTGGLTGGLIGGALPVVSSVVSTAAKPLIAPIMARLRPDEYANSALGVGLQRSGKSVDDVVNALSAARADGQGVFNTADAMGTAGKRLLSTAARNPNDARQAVVEALESRQAGQGRRVVNALSEGFAAPDTAAQRVSTLTASRDAAADVGYDAARKGAGAVDVSPVIAKIDETLKPGVNQIVNPGSGIANDTVESALARVRAVLTDGKSQATDFDTLLRARYDLNDQIGRAVRAGSNNQARLLGGVQKELDAALEAASQPYAAARNAFRQGSKEVEAVDAGRQAAQRGRPEDSIAGFTRLSSGEQNAFRAGYSDPLIEQAQGAPVGVNKVRPLMNDAMGAEFPTFAAPGKADQLNARIARESTMFDTRYEALGNSKTAQRTADDSDFAQFDPTIMQHLSQGKLIAASTTALMKAWNAGKGTPPAVLERVAHALLETNPDAARQILNAANSKALSDNGRRAVVNALLTSLGSTSGARLSVP